MDSAGTQLRADVRATAQKIWPMALAFAQRELRDGWHALNLLESSVSEISRYLERHEAPESGRDLSRLLMRTFWRRLRRKQKSGEQKLLIVELDSLEEYFASPDSFNAIQSKLDLAKFRNIMSERNWQVFTLRAEKWRWKEIAELLGVSIDTAKLGYYRELRRVRRQLQSSFSGA